jgi:hypothetical protein
MSDGDPLRALLHRKIQEASEAAGRDGEVPAAQLDEVNRLTRLVEIRDKAFATMPPRWRIAAVLAATLLLVSLLLFLRVRETQVEMQLVVSEVSFVLTRAQVVTDIMKLAELSASGLRGVQLPDPELAAPADQKAVRVTSLESGTLTLDPVSLASGAAVRIDAERSQGTFKLGVSHREPATFQATAHGPIRFELPGSESRDVDLAIPKSLVLGSDPAGATLDLALAKGSTAAFSPQVAIRRLDLSRVDEFHAPEGTMTQAVSTILAGTIYLESLNGEARPLRPRELLRFSEIRGVIRTIELGDGRVTLAFRGTVRGMRSGWGTKPVTLMPTWLDWLRAQHGLALLWGTTLYLFGLVTAILRWWRVAV